MKLTKVAINALRLIANDGYQLIRVNQTGGIADSKFFLIKNAGSHRTVSATTFHTLLNAGYIFKRLTIGWSEKQVYELSGKGRDYLKGLEEGRE